MAMVVMVVRPTSILTRLVMTMSTMNVAMAAVATAPMPATIAMTTMVMAMASTRDGEAADKLVASMLVMMVMRSIFTVPPIIITILISITIRHHHLHHP